MGALLCNRTTAKPHNYATTQPHKYNINKTKSLRVFTAFSGYDSQCMALNRLKEAYPGFDYELVGWSEIDKYAIAVHNRLFPEAAGKNYGDISKIDWSQVPDFDFFTYSFPCQSISAAGLQHGLKEGSGTRSSLLWECRKAILAKRPKYMMMENVKALVSKRNMPDFQRWLDELESYGYYNTWSVLNARDYGVPQNRERCFCISILRTADDPNPTYTFPQPFPLTKVLEDMLEDGPVDEKYYLSDKALEYFERTNAAPSHHHCFKPKKKSDIAAMVRAADGTGTDDNYIMIKTIKTM